VRRAERQRKEKALGALETQIMELWGNINAATARFLELVAEFDRREGWAQHGMASCAQWLSWQCGIGRVAATEKVRTARALESLPKISAAFGEGRLSYSKVRALTRVATVMTEDTLLHIALNGTAAHVERTVRGFRRVKRYLERDEAEAMHERRHLLCWRESDGSVTLNARLTPEVGELLFKALDAAQAQLEERSEEAVKTGPPIPVDGSVSAETPAQSPETTAPSPDMPAQPAAPNNSRFSMRSAAWPSTPAPRVADGVASVWTTTSPSMRCAGRRAILDGPYKRARATIRIEPLPANQVSMKKYLPVFAALFLAGCAHSQYRATYLEEYAGYDCYELQAERLAVEDELGPKWVKGRSAENTMSTALFFSDAGPGGVFGWPGYDGPPYSDNYIPGRPNRQKERMKNHARWQALAQLEQNKGCRQEVSGSPALHE